VAKLPCAMLCYAVLCYAAGREGMRFNWVRSITEDLHADRLHVSVELYY